MKRLLLLTLLFVSFAAMPAMAQLETNTTKIIVSEQLDKFLDIMDISVNPVERYTASRINLRQQPDENSEIICQELTNTKLEVIVETNGWSAVRTADGLAYVKTELLSETIVVPYTEEELYIMAHVLAGEAQNSSDEEQRYVGSVVLNRVKSSRFPNTIKSVVFQPGQYACTWDGNYNRTPTERNWANARYLLENGSVFPENVVWQSKVKQGRGVYIKTSAHYYCY